MNWKKCLNWNRWLLAGTLCLLAYSWSSFQLGSLKARMAIAMDEDAECVQPITVPEFERCSGLFSETLGFATGMSQGTFSYLQREWRTSGCTLEELELGDEVFLVVGRVAEVPGDEGVFFFRCGPLADQELFLQAPHAMCDFHTGEIALTLFEEGGSRVRAAGLSTCNRDTRCGTGETDLSHREHSLFQAFNVASAAAIPHATIVQIHGFDQDKRKSEAAKAADLILACGQTKPTPLAESVIRSIVAGQWIDAPRLYGAADPTLAVDELGALTNAQYAMLKAQQLAAANFVHLELSLETRIRLLRDHQARNELLNDLTPPSLDSALAKADL